MDLMVLFFFCDLFCGLGMLKGLEQSLCGDIGLVVLSGLGSRRTHPDGVEGASMARRAPFPPSRMPASVEISIKLVVCLSEHTEGSGGATPVAPQRDSLS
uniref:Secreted protein n=1 Tax=Cryptomonas curvata TaxID=233186 RepID=A0A7S0MI34_9CRYP|mmetsp:Transcript_42454/g.88795  ORF Transcript_42454/g.88795 Transcript_42454/m.88795 type:complete len:100 (+) Transcript_42454:289-588(+)